MSSLPNLTGANVFERVADGTMLTKFWELNLVRRKLIDLESENSTRVSFSRFPKSAQNLVKVSTVFFALRFEVESPYVLLFSPCVFHYHKLYMNISSLWEKKDRIMNSYLWSFGNDAKFMFVPKWVLSAVFYRHIQSAVIWKSFIQPRSHDWYIWQVRRQLCIVQDAKHVTVILIQRLGYLAEIFDLVRLPNIWSLWSRSHTTLFSRSVFLDLPSMEESPPLKTFIS
jgi:hypothetical protein